MQFVFGIIVKYADNRLKTNFENILDLALRSTSVKKSNDSLVAAFSNEHQKEEKY